MTEQQEAAAKKFTEAIVEKLNAGPHKVARTVEIRMPKGAEYTTVECIIFADNSDIAGTVEAGVQNVSAAAMIERRKA